MADAATTIFAMVKPEVGASADTWGSKLNTNFDDIDALAGAIITTGSANAYVLTSGLSLAAYVTGQRFLIKTNFANTGAATINVDSLGAKNLTKNGTTALASGDLANGVYYFIVYDGTQFQIVGALNNTVQPLDALLSAMAALTTADDSMLDFTGTDTVAVVNYATVASNIGAVTTTGWQNIGGGKTFTSDMTLSKSSPSFTIRDTGASNVRFVDQVSAGARKCFVTNDSFSPFNLYLQVSQTSEVPTIAEFDQLDLRIEPQRTNTETNSVGYLGSPVISGNSAYAFPREDSGKTIYHDEAGTRTWTIPANASVAHPIGTCFILDNTGNSGAAGAITLAITSDTLRRGDGVSGTGSRTIPAGGVACIRKVTSTIWIITGVFT